MPSDKSLREAYNKQLRNMNPGLVYLAWQGQQGMDPDDLLDDFNEVAEGKTS